MTINEGILNTDTATALKSEMLRQLDLQQETTPDAWERAVFESLTGYCREDVDWDEPGNQAAYFLWIRSFDQFISELEEDGCVVAVERGDGRKVLRKTLWDPSIDYSQLVYAPRLPR
jgi:hypothetical protein